MPVDSKFPHTAHGLRILGILRKHGGWMNRTAIASELGKTKLNHHDRALLEGLSEAGQVEIQTNVRDESFVVEYIYRATSQE